MLNQKQTLELLFSLLDTQFARFTIASNLSGVNFKKLLDLHNYNKQLTDAEFEKLQEGLEIIKPVIND